MAWSICTNQSNVRMGLEKREASLTLLLCFWKLCQKSRIHTLLITILSLPSTVGKAGVCLLSLPPSPWGWAPTSVLYCTGPLLPGIRSQLLGSPPGSDVGHSRSDWPGHSSTEQFHLHISVPCLQRKTIFTAQLVYSHTHHNMTTSPETSLKGTAMCLFTHVRVVFISLGKWYNVYWVFKKTFYYVNLCERKWAYHSTWVKVRRQLWKLILSYQVGPEAWTEVVSLGGIFTWATEPVFWIFRYS